MSFKEHSKEHKCSNNICWLLASDDARSRHIKQSERHCERLYFPRTTSGTPKRVAQEKSLNDSESFLDERTSDIFIADQTLITALRIHPNENQCELFTSTESKANHWPWLVACRSVFVHRETLSLCDIGTKQTYQRSKWGVRAKFGTKGKILT